MDINTFIDNFAGQFDDTPAGLVDADGEHGFVGPYDVRRFDVLMDSRQFGEIAEELRRQLRLSAIDGHPILEFLDGDGGAPVRIDGDDGRQWVIGEDGGIVDELWIAVSDRQAVAYSRNLFEYHVAFGHGGLRIEGDVDAHEGGGLLRRELSVGDDACIVEEDDDASVAFHLFNFLAEFLRRGDGVGDDK